MDFQTDGRTVIIYQYQPSDVAAGIFIGLFGIAVVAHIVEAWRLGTPFFSPMIIGCIMEAFGYYGRFWGAHSSGTNFGAYCLQSFMLLLGPTFMAATMYVALARVGVFCKRTDLLLSRGRCSKLFVIGDVICLLVQIGGLGLRVTTSTSLQNTGRVVLVVVLVLQMLLTVLYLGSVASFRAKVYNLDGAAQPQAKWERYLVVLMVSSGCLILRNLVRTVEFAQGPNGFVAVHEVFVYVCDGLPMVTMVGLLIVVHPGQLKKTMNRTLEGSEGKVGGYDGEALLLDVNRG